MAFIADSTTGAEPDKTDVGIYATGFLSAGASVVVDLLKAHVDDDMNKRLTEVQKRKIQNDRYEIFKTGAEAELGKEWNCPAMEKLAPLTGIE